MNIISDQFEGRVEGNIESSNSIQFFTTTLNPMGDNQSHTFTSTTEIGSYTFGIQGFDFFFSDQKNHEISEMGVQLQATKSTDNKSITISIEQFIMDKEDQHSISENATVGVILITAGDDCLFSTSNPANSALTESSVGTFMKGWHTVSNDVKESGTIVNHKVDSWNFDAGVASASGADYDITDVVASVGSGETKYTSEVFTGVIGALSNISNPVNVPYIGVQNADPSQHCLRFPYDIKEVQTVLVGFENLGDHGTGDEDDSVKQFYVSPLVASVDGRDRRQVNLHWEGTRAETLLNDGVDGLIHEELAGIAALQGGWVGATSASHFPSQVSFLVIAKYDTDSHLKVLPNPSVPNIVAMHDDTASSDTTLLAGPGTGRLSISHHNILASGTTMLRRSDGHIMAVVSSFEDAVEGIIDSITGKSDPNSGDPAVNPQIWLLDKDSGRAIGPPLDLEGGSIMGGIYAYLDQNDNTLYMASPIDDVINIIKVTADPNSNSGPLYDSNGTIPLSLVDGDSVVAISPDADGDIWYSTAQGFVGIIQSGNNDIQDLRLGRSETVNNSFSVVTITLDGNAVQMAAVATNENLYLIQKTNDAPELVSTFVYDAGSAAKPGQLAYPPANHQLRRGWGTGATPTFFGPETGCEYVMITDNADGQLNVLVWATDGSSNQPIIQHQLFTGSDDNGTENSAIGYGNSIIVSSTYGYPYPVPHYFIPKNHPFNGGMERIDIVVDRSDPDNITYSSYKVWKNSVRSAAVPKLSIADRKIYTMTRIGNSNVARPEDYYAYAVISFETGRLELEYDLRRAERLGKSIPGETVLFALDNPLQMASCMSYTSDQMPVMWQGTMDGFFRIEMDYERNIHNTAAVIEKISDIKTKPGG